MRDAVTKTAHQGLRAADAFHPLRRRPALTPWQSLGVRILLVLGLMGVALAVHWFDRDGLRDNIDGSISFVDVIYFTTITITTVGYGDIVPVSDQASCSNPLSSRRSGSSSG